MLELPQATQLGGTETAVFFLPVVERRIADAQFPADLFDADSQLRLLQGKGDLLLSEFASLHDIIPVSHGENHARNSNLKRDYLLGSGQDTVKMVYLINS